MNDDRDKRNRIIEKAMPEIKMKIRNFFVNIGEPVVSGFNVYSRYKPL